MNQMSSAISTNDQDMNSFQEHKTENDKTGEVAQP